MSTCDIYERSKSWLNYPNFSAYSQSKSDDENNHGQNISCIVGHEKLGILVTAAGLTLKIWDAKRNRLLREVTIINHRWRLLNLYIQ
jgi:hypothetical protein